MAEFGLEPLPFTFDDFKNHIAAFVRDEYGASSLDTGKKALHVHKDHSERVSVDVVPAFVSALWCASKSDPWVWFSDDWRVAIFVLHNRPTRCRLMVDPSSIYEGTNYSAPSPVGRTAWT
jgi:hypothetical protein